MDNLLTSPKRLLILDIDGLRQDVFHQAIANNLTPNLEKLFNTNNSYIHLDPLTTFPSITFTAQSSIFTGAYPKSHGVYGNQFFDRFGVHNAGIPRFYAFDVGDTLAIDDAVRVFTGDDGMLSDIISPDTKTIYELAAQHGKTSCVVHHMVSRGATNWLKPGILNIARFTRGNGIFGMSAEEYDQSMLEKTIDFLHKNDCPNILTVYFMGLDHHSHLHGPSAQIEYLSTVIDPQVGQLLQELASRNLTDQMLVVIVSDHGQTEVAPDDLHSLRISFPFDREMGYLFDKLGLDIHDIPGEDPNCDAVVASNGGMAHVYLQNKIGIWQEKPRFSTDVRPVAQAFWEGNQTGRYTTDLVNALALILIRNVEQDGWHAPYQAYTPDNCFPLAEYLADHKELIFPGFENRLAEITGPQSGDIILVSNYDNQKYFGSPMRGVHGGPGEADSRAVLSFSTTFLEHSSREITQKAILDAAQKRMQTEKRDFSMNLDMVSIISTLLGW